MELQKLVKSLIDRASEGSYWDFNKTGIVIMQICLKILSVWQTIQLIICRMDILYSE